MNAIQNFLKSNYIYIFLVVALVSLISAAMAASNNKNSEASMKKVLPNGLVTTKNAPDKIPDKTEIAGFAAGCFWGVEEEFRKTKGVIATAVGYSGGHTENPTYEDVCGDQTGHAETVEVEFDPKVVSYQQLVDLFFNLHDPTTVNRQGPDFGSQYRSVVFYHNDEQKKIATAAKEKLNKSGELRDPVVTEIIPASKFYKAEEYHQQYVEKGGRAACHFRRHS